MKFFVFSFVLIVLGLVSPTFASNQPNGNSEKAVIMTLTYEDGTMLEHSYTTTTEFFTASFERYEKSLVLCTVSFSNGECSTTASTCAAAMAGFKACACAVGNCVPSPS